MQYNIELAEAREVFDYNPETGEVTWKKGRPTSFGHFDESKKGQPCGWFEGDGYLKTSFKNIEMPVHRLAWFLHHGEWPEKMLDHKDRDKQNNRLVNLREATYQDNARNSNIYCTNTSGAKGVSYNTGNKTYEAYIKIDGVKRHLGYYKEFAAARKVREMAERLIFGDFSTLHRMPLSKAIKAI